MDVDNWGCVLPDIKTESKDTHWCLLYKEQVWDQYCIDKKRGKCRGCLWLSRKVSLEKI